MDKFTPQKRSEIMSKIRSKETNFEKTIFNELKNRGLKFKTNYAGIIGKPDIAIVKTRKAVFLHSDFWHGWQFSRWEKILPSEFWKQKIRNNRKRDRVVMAKLKKLGWRVKIIWEHSYRKNKEKTIRDIANFLK